MPLITVSYTTSRQSPSLKAGIANAVSELTAKILHKDPKVTAIIVKSVDADDWFAGGKSLAAHGTNTFWLDIKVVDGTNTKLELEAYLKAIFEAFGRLLGGVHEESYAFVHEVPAAAYGYGGKSQEFRFISGRLKAA